MIRRLNKLLNVEKSHFGGFSDIVSYKSLSRLSWMTKSVQSLKWIWYRRYCAEWKWILILVHKSGLIKIDGFYILSCVLGVQKSKHAKLDDRNIPMDFIYMSMWVRIGWCKSLTPYVESHRPVNVCQKVVFLNVFHIHRPSCGFSRLC